jgi:uncharacterized protein (TIGR02466 family)
MDVCDLFPSGLSVHNLSVDESSLNKIMKLSKDSDNFDRNNNGNFLHKETYIFDTILKDSKLVKDIYECIDEHVTKISGEKPNLRITQSWLNINPPGTSHHRHSHGNSILSGVLYIQTNELSGNFVVHTPNKRAFGGFIEEFNRYNYEFIYFTPKKFDLFLFQSSLDHSVNVNESQEDRLSISFNTFYRSDFTMNGGLTELRLPV